MWQDEWKMKCQQELRAFVDSNKMRHRTHLYIFA